MRGILSVQYSCATAAKADKLTGRTVIRVAVTLRVTSADDAQTNSSLERTDAMNRTTWALALVVVLPTAPVSGSEHWPQFRGPQSLGVAENPNLPDQWTSTEQVLWKRDIPGRGWSSPIVWGKRVFLTTVINEGQSEEPKKGLYFGGDRLALPDTIHQWKVLCLDRDSGNVIWEQLAHQGVPQSSLHIKNSYASETPVTDGERVYVYFGNLGVFCYSLDGDLVWSARWPPRQTRFGWGTGASPTLHGDRLYVVSDNEEDSYLVALDKRTGQEVWRIERDEKSNWATPFIWENELRSEIITPGTGMVRSYDLDGNLLYQFGGCSSITVATPYSQLGLLYVSSGYILDNRKPIFALRPGASGDISLEGDQTSNPYIVWCQRQAAPYNPTTLVYDELMYVLLDRGFLACYDARTGEPVYERQRLPNGGAFTASPWAYNGRVFCLSEYGVTFVVAAGREFRLLNTNPLADDDMCMASPAMAGPRLLIRTAARIYCLSRQSGHESRR